MSMEIDYEALAAGGIQEDLPRDLNDAPSQGDPHAARRRLEALLEERRVRREIAALDMDSFDIQDMELYE